MFRTIDEDKAFLRAMFTTWSEPLGEALDAALTDTDLWCLIAQMALVNVGRGIRKYPVQGQRMVDVCRRIVGEDYIDGEARASIELMVSANTCGMRDERYVGYPYNHIWLRGGALTWHRDRYEDGELQGMEQVKAFIRWLTDSESQSEPKR